MEPAGVIGTAATRAEARRVLAFWFDELTPEQHFTKDDALDAAMRERFGDRRDAVLASGAEGWLADADSALAAVILLDQISRNIHRDTAEAFRADPLALFLCLEAIERGFHRALAPERRGFLYMPLMHAEDAGVQRFALARFAEPGLEHQAGFAREHAAVIFRFGRYPSRNAALGRTSTPAELEYLAQPGAGW